VVDDAAKLVFLVKVVRNFLIILIAYLKNSIEPSLSSRKAKKKKKRKKKDLFTLKVLEH